jgi:hypothetical protein
LNYYNYFTEIEEAFVRRRGRNLLLSPLDWALIESWQERDVPLHIVLRAIESVFDAIDKKPGAQLRGVKTLAYCKEEIEAQYVEWLQSRAGGGAEVDAEDGDGGGLTVQSVSEHIANVIQILGRSTNENIREEIERACARLEELKAGLTGDLERAEKVLTDIENFIDRALLTKSDGAHLNDLEKEISGQIGSYRASMGEETYRKTLDLMLLKRLREEEGIPPLSLFYL